MSAIKSQKSTRVKIEEQLASKSFLWAEHALREISGLRRREYIEEALQKFPDDLNDKFAQTVEQFSAQEGRPKDINTLLTWVMFARRSLRLVEVELIMALNSKYLEGYFALETTIRRNWSTFFKLDRIDGKGTDKLEDLGRRQYRNQQQTDSDNYESPRSTTEISFSHLAIKEYLRNPKKKTAVGVDAAKAELIIATACLSFICDDAMVKKWGDDEPFLDYAANFFSKHVSLAAPEHAGPAEKELLIRYIHQAFTDPQTFQRWSRKVCLADILLKDKELEFKLVSWIAAGKTVEGVTPELRQWAEAVEAGGLRQLLEPGMMQNAALWLRNVSPPTSAFWYELWRYIKKASIQLEQLSAGLF
jgi:hypothetical protein